MAKSMDRYPGIDLVKFLMAIVVVSIHTLPAGFFTAPAAKFGYDFLCASAVPFFFISSGFLLAQKADLCSNPGRNALTDVVSQSLRKFLYMYVLWMLIYAPLTVWYLYHTGWSPLWSVFYYLRGFFLVGEHYNSWPLWYLLSTIYGLCFLYLLSRKKVKLNRIVLCSYILFLCGAMVSYLFDHADMLPGALSRIASLLSSVIFPGRIVNGFLYISVGMFAYHHRFSNKMGIVFLLLGTAVMLSGNELLKTLCGMLPNLGIFILASNLTLKNASVFLVLRKLSVVLYFLHMYVWTFYYSIIYRKKTYGFDSFLVTTLVCIVLGMIYAFAKKPAARSNRQT